MYENVILLIEFDNFNFHLTPFGRMKGQFNRTYTRLITLCLLTNNLQLMWSNGPQVTSRLVRRLKVFCVYHISIMVDRMKLLLMLLLKIFYHASSYCLN